jgi:hypothetical protein
VQTGAARRWASFSGSARMIADSGYVLTLRRRRGMAELVKNFRSQFLAPIDRGPHRGLKIPFRPMSEVEKQAENKSNAKEKYDRNKQCDYAFHTFHLLILQFQPS